MARRTRVVTITAEGRDKGKSFSLKEMPADQAERWAIRALLALAAAGAKLPDGALDAGIAGVAAVEAANGGVAALLVGGLKSLAGLDYSVIAPLLDEMMACIQYVPPAKTILVPTLHDEPPAYLKVYAQRYASYPNRIWLTDSEQRVAGRLWNVTGGEVVGMAVEHTESAGREERAAPYFLYCGRIEEGKGCRVLLDAFRRFRKQSGIDATLVMTGVDNMKLPKRADIEFLGFVDEQRKLALMAGAAAFVLPSEYESFSIVTLEAMAQRTPTLVNGKCEVLRDHIDRSGAGFHYETETELAALMERVLKLDAASRARMGEAGRNYVMDRYSEPRIRDRLVEVVQRIADGATQDASSSAY